MKSAATNELGRRIFRGESCPSIASRRLCNSIPPGSSTHPRQLRRSRLCCVLAILILALGCSNSSRTSTSATGPSQAAKLENDECERLHKKRPFTAEQDAASWKVTGIVAEVCRSHSSCRRATPTRGSSYQSVMKILSGKFWVDNRERHSFAFLSLNPSIL